MPYVQRQDILTLVSTPDLTDFLDDNRDGGEDPGLLDSIIAQCSLMADAYVQPTYNTPFSTPPVQVQMATLIFVCEALYARRYTPEEHNPFKDRADQWRSILRKVGVDGTPLVWNQDRIVPPVVASFETSIVNDNML